MSISIPKAFTTTLVAGTLVLAEQSAFAEKTEGGDQSINHLPVIAKIVNSARCEGREEYKEECDELSNIIREKCRVLKPETSEGDDKSLVNITPINLESFKTCAAASAILSELSHPEDDFSKEKNRLMYGQGLAGTVFDVADGSENATASATFDPITAEVRTVLERSFGTDDWLKVEACADGDGTTYSNSRDNTTLVYEVPNCTK